ncbi:MAG TPA: VOC family protein [Steroidobacteraceae bacterium]
MPMYSELFPILLTSDLDRALRFYRDLLGGTVTYQYAGPDGRLLFVSLRIGDSSVGLGVSNDAPRADIRQRPVLLWVYTDDCDGAIERLREAGVTVTAEPEDKDWGERVACVLDPDGNEVMIGQGAETPHRPRLASKTVGVMGSGTNPQPELSEPLGKLLASLNVNLLTGGGSGVMEAVAAAYVRARPRAGISIGVLPASSNNAATPIPGYPNPYVQLAIATHLPDRGRKGHLVTSRNHINVLSSDVIVALPGSHGTESELRLALRYNKKAAIFYSDAATIEHFPQELPRFDRLEELEAFLRVVLDLSEA